MIIRHTQILDALVYSGQDLILPRFQNLKASDIRAKDTSGGMTISSDDLVTIVDQEVEVFLTHALTAILPGSLVIGEEAAAESPQQVEKKLQEQGYVWVLDPLDGTTNFKEGREEFCIMLALRYKKQTIQSFIYCPLTSETVFTERGSGAFLNDQRLEPLQSLPLSESKGWVGKILLKRETEHFDSVSKICAGVSTLGCAGLEYLSLAKGQSQFSLYKKALPWDHLPGLFLCEELGGFSAQWDAQSYPSSGYDDGILTAANKEDWHRLYDLLVKPIPRH